MTPRTIRLAAGTVLSLAAMTAFAQPAATTPNGQTPGTVGVTPQTAAEATQKAVPRSDTGTVVRTAPSAADKARSATTDRGTTSTAGNAGMAPSATGTATDGTMAGTPPAPATPMAPRRARADRN